MAAGSDSWLAPLREAYEQPWTVARFWRGEADHDGGGRVVGVLGRTVPRELIVAHGMLPIRLSPLRLGPSARPHPDPDPSLTAELAPGPALVLAALLDGRLDWVDALVVGRDSEAWTKFFYVLRELAATPAPPRLPPIAFFDLLRLPGKTSARYSRLRARELSTTLAEWAGRIAGPDAFRWAAREHAATAASLRRVAELPIRGSELLIAAGAAQALPGQTARRALDAAAAPFGETMAGRAVRLFVTGSGQDDPWAYESLEGVGLVVVGDDHEWGEDRAVPHLTEPDPLEGIVDRVHLGMRGAARAGLHDRVRSAVAAVRSSGAQAVLQIRFEHDEAPGWELPLLRAQLGERIPIESVRLVYGKRDEQAIVRAAERLLQCVRHGEAHAPRDGSHV